MYNPCPLLDNFIEFGRKKEEKKGRNQFLMLLENKSHGDDNNNHDDEDFPLGTESEITTPVAKSEKSHNAFNTEGVQKTKNSVVSD